MVVRLKQVQHHPTPLSVSWVKLAVRTRGPLKEYPRRQAPDLTGLQALIPSYADL